MIERRGDQRLERVLSLVPKEDDPYADISPAQALDDAYVALHSPNGMTPEEYTQVRDTHSKRLLRVLDSFTKRVIFGSYRANAGRVFPCYPGSNQMCLYTPEVFSGITIKKNGDEEEWRIDYAKRRKDLPNWGGWDYRIDLTYDPFHTYAIFPEDFFKCLEVNLLQEMPPDPGVVPVTQRWKAVFNNGVITYMDKSFVLPIDVVPDPQQPETERIEPDQKLLPEEQIQIRF